MTALLGWFMAVLHRGRHHVRTATRPADGGLVTVSTIAARIRREAIECAHGAIWLPVIPDVHPFDATIQRALGKLKLSEAFAGAMA